MQSSSVTYRWIHFTRALTMLGAGHTQEIEEEADDEEEDRGGGRGPKEEEAEEEERDDEEEEGDDEPEDTESTSKIFEDVCILRVAICTLHSVYLRV